MIQMAICREEEEKKKVYYIRTKPEEKNSDLRKLGCILLERIFPILSKFAKST